MNKIILMGRLTRDPEIRYSQGEKPMAIARYSLAVDKKYEREDGVKTDFFNIVAFHHQADFAVKYFRQGTKVLLSGRVQTGNYDKNGVKMSFFEVIAEEQEFAESKGVGKHNTSSKVNKEASVSEDEDGFVQLPDDMDELPFN